MENMGKMQRTGMSTRHSHIKPALRYIASNSRIPKSSPKKSQYMDNITREEDKIEF